MRWRWRTTFVLCAASLLFAVGSSVQAQLPLFPGAEGFGGTFTGTAPSAGWFSDATVYHVTTLQDDLGPDDKGAPGTLRGAFREKTANKIIVFDVAGTIQLNPNKTLDMKSISNYYIAGQTAPGPVTVYGNTTQITHSNDTVNSNVILRYMSFRKGTGSGADAITFAGGPTNGSGTVATNMIIDHVSASWSEDEVLSVTNNNTNVTVQYAMMTDSLTNGHQYGSLIRPKVDSNVSFHHNLYGNDKSRNPRLGSYNYKLLTADVRNNVIYNWSDRATYAGGNSDSDGVTEYVNANYVGNYGIAGPATPAGGKSETLFTEDAANNPIVLHLYQSGNYIDSDQTANPGGTPNGSDMGWNSFSLWNGSTSQPIPDGHKEATPFSVPAVTTQSAPSAYDSVIDYVGNWWWNRDVIDQRIIGNVENNTQPAGGIPALAPIPGELTYVTSAAYPAAPTTHPVGYDTDGDAMPDAWELAHGLNPNSGADWNADFDSDGYINLIEYINEAGEFPAPAPIVFNGTTNTRYAQITNWKTNDGGITAGSNWQPSKYDEARINSGTVVVDAVGQHAGLLKIGSNAGNNATLNVTSGWLQVADAVVVGADPAATAALNLSGGVLDTPELSKGAGGTFSFTGGTLHVDEVNFDLVNNGGTLSPGHSVGQTHVAGDLTLAAGSLAIELASSSVSDTLVVDGDTALGGALNVSLLGSFTPAQGDHWQIITAGGVSGAFGSVTAGYSVQQQGSNLQLYFGPAPPLTLAGDYNDDGIVDAADYTVWRDALAAGGSLQNETASLGSVDGDDYLAWKQNFGAHSGPGGGSLGSVPEPGSAVLLMAGLTACAVRRRNRELIRGRFVAGT